MELSKRKIYTNLFLTLFIFSALGSINAQTSLNPGVNDRSGWSISSLDTARNVDYLSDLEKDIILELNMVRSDPGKYAELYVLPRMQYFQGNRYTEPGKITLITSEGSRAVLECYQDLRNTAVSPVLLPSRGLSQAARDHVTDTGPRGIIGHTGSDGSSMSQRMNRYGSWRIGASENVSYGHNTAREIILQLLIDDGVASRGHRVNIMNANIRHVGVSAGPHTGYTHMCVQKFANDYTENTPDTSRPQFFDTPNTTSQITIVNNTGYTIFYVYISPITSQSWGEDRLGPTETIRNGGSVSLQLPHPISTVSRYDIRLVDSDGDSYIKYDVRVTANSRIVFVFDDIVYR